MPHASCVLTLQGPTGQEREVEAVIDTGYSGFLTTSLALVSGTSPSRPELCGPGRGSEVVFGFYAPPCCGTGTAAG